MLEASQRLRGPTDELDNRRAGQFTTFGGILRTAPGLRTHERRSFSKYYFLYSSQTNTDGKFSLRPPSTSLDFTHIRCTSLLSNQRARCNARGGRVPLAGVGVHLLPLFLQTRRPIHGDGLRPVREGLRAQIHVKMLPYKPPPWLTAARLKAAANGTYH